MTDGMRVRVSAHLIKPTSDVCHWPFQGGTPIFPLINVCLFLCVFLFLYPFTFMLFSCLSVVLLMWLSAVYVVFAARTLPSHLQARYCRQMPTAPVTASCRAPRWRRQTRESTRTVTSASSPKVALIMGTIYRKFVLRGKVTLSNCKRYSTEHKLIEKLTATVL